MQITLIRKDAGGIRIRNRKFESVMESIKVETKSRPVSCYREKIDACRNDGIQFYGDIDLPSIRFSGLYTIADGQPVWSACTGLVLVEVNGLPNTMESTRVKEAVAWLPQTLAAFTGASAQSVKIIIPFIRPDGTLPQTWEEAMIFQAHAYRKAVDLCRPVLPYPVEIRESLPGQECLFSFDPGLYYNRDATPIPLPQPLSLPVEEQTVTEVETIGNHIEKRSKAMHLFNNCYREARHLNETENAASGPIPFLCKLALACHRSGMKEEEAVYNTMLYLDQKATETDIRDIFRNIYSTAYGFGSIKSNSPLEALARRTEEFMQRRYEFRYNSLLRQVEFRRKQSFVFRFNIMDERGLNSIALDALQEGLNIWDRDVRRYIYSDRIPTYNPLDHYLENLPAWDGKDRIRELAGRIPCNFPDWSEFFYRWLLNTTAQWLGKNNRYANCYSPLLSGEQGTGKSTFCKQLLPPSLNYLYTDSIDFGKRRDAELYLNRFALINMDEFDQISPRHQGLLKHILQKTNVDTRLAYTSSVNPLRRYASFIGTTNHTDILTDLTGNRRFICVTVTGKIENEQPINHDQIYAQAVHLIRNGERYHFTAREEAILIKQNNQYRRIPAIEQLFHQYFTTAASGNEYKEYLAIELLNHIRKKSGLSLSECKTNEFGRVLHRLGIPNRRTSQGIVYKIREIETTDPYK